MELRKIALQSALEVYKHEAIDHDIVLKAAEVFYQWLRGEQTESLTGKALNEYFGQPELPLPEPGEPIWKHKSVGVTCVMPEFWPQYRATGHAGTAWAPGYEPKRSVPSCNGKYDILDTDWPNPVTS